MARRGVASGSGGRKAATADLIFPIAERIVVALYDGGVLSPAVLERVLAGFMESDIDWNSPPGRQTVDGKSLHEVVALTMMPGRSTRNASKDFLAVIEHLCGAKSKPHDVDQSPADSSDDDLLSQLAGATTKRKASDTPSRRTQPGAGFNPLVHATSPGRKPAK
jgi:hypothetical protein